jgi:hypothetical protein
MGEIMTALPVLSIIVSLFLVIGAFFAFRVGHDKTASEIQEKVIEALRAQTEAQELQIKTCEKEIARLKRVVATIQIALKRRGLQIEIDNDSITIIDNQGRSSRTVQILIDSDEMEKVTTTKEDT